MPDLIIPAPSPKQKLFLTDKHKRIAFGGARGGGKSWAVRVKSCLLCLNYSGIRILIIRRTYEELRKNHITQLKAMLAGIAKYTDKDKSFKFRNGSVIELMYCERDNDLDRLQGVEYDVIFMDEATQLSEYQMKTITACIRGVNNFPKRIYYTCNPGGQGHTYIKRLFVDRQFRENENPEEYSFIQSLVTDNKALMQADPEYVKYLEALPPKLREAWLYGRWDIFQGQFFEDFIINPPTEEDRAARRWCHVIEPFDIARGDCRGWTIARSFDWGYSHPFSCGWWAVDYNGTAYRIMELYGGTETPNEGVKWTPERVFSEIYRVEHEHPWLSGREITGIADPAIWDSSSGISIQETAAKQGVYFRPGDHKRIPGWMQMHYRFAFDDNGYPRMYVFSNCKHFIRTIPTLMYDDIKVEDLDTDGEDHCLVGDTQVLTKDGYKTIQDLVGTEGDVISHDGKYHRYHDVGITRKQADILKIELEDGTNIYCTEDHRFMLPNGEWINAKNLSAGMEVKTYDSTGNQ